MASFEISTLYGGEPDSWWAVPAALRDIVVPPSNPFLDLHAERSVLRSTSSGMNTVLPTKTAYYTSVRIATTIFS